ncbi:MAG TPA: flagellar export protein FliJ [Candidatus Atribacteria bacterium]|nr:flagellar export protein FliJ [Candidatus Atribacteria bacterium]
MKGYQFKLQKVLDVRKVKEDLIGARVAELEEIIEAQKGHLLSLEKKKEGVLVERREKREIDNGFRIEGEMFYEWYLENLERKVEVVKTSLKQLEEQMRKTREELIKAAVDRKIMEKLKDKDYENFKVEVIRNDQKNLDEITIQRYKRGIE